MVCGGWGVRALELEGTIFGCCGGRNSVVGDGELVESRGF